jgi:hypothetical protein
MTTKSEKTPRESFMEKHGFRTGLSAGRTTAEDFKKRHGFSDKKPIMSFLMG